jgi:hypothetical protein
MNFWDTNSLLRQGLKRRVAFDPDNLTHLEELRYFKMFSRWRDGCPFELEWPYNDINSMVNDKFLLHSLSKLKVPKKNKK